MTTVEVDCQDVTVLLPTTTLEAASAPIWGLIRRLTETTTIQERAIAEEVGILAREALITIPRGSGRITMGVTTEIRVAEIGHTIRAITKARQVAQTLAV